MSSATFTPGYNTAQRTANPYGTATALKFAYPAAFKACGWGPNKYGNCHMKNDFAILKLDRAYTNWMAYGYDESNTADTVINTAGYPGANGSSCLALSKVSLSS